MIPIISIIGRNNVGKSTIFNQFTKTKDALVTDIPGTTRDRQYGYVSINNKKLIFVDTAGLSDQNHTIIAIKNKTVNQTNIAIQMSDIIVFVVNAYEGLLPTDYDIINNIRKTKQNIFLVINKIDLLRNDISFKLEFYDLGFQKIYYVSALKKIGFSSLVDDFLKQIKYLQETSIHTVHRKDKNSSILYKDINHFCSNNHLKLIVLGKPNVGKSTLINSLIGEQRVITHDCAGTTRDMIFIPLLHENKKYILIDTAGILKIKHKTNYIQYISSKKTLSYIDKSNVVLLVIDVLECITNQDLSLLNVVMKLGKSMIILINKWDLIPVHKRKFTRLCVEHKLKFLKNFKIHYISALHSMNVKKIMLMADRLYKLSMTKLSSLKLNIIMKSAVGEHAPPLINGHKIKFKYVHPGGYDPLIVIVHGTKLKYLINSYKQYLINYFQRSLNLINIPLKLYFKDHSKVL
ncbi:MAG: ribosome biogenesis GTPase Der [Buchnera aphidicola (Eriosoma harunire)]